MKLTASGKATPCPICRRTADADCRFTNELVLCHSGAEAHNLRPGDTIEADGCTWYLSRTEGGHSGRAHIYRVHRERHLPSRAERKRERHRSSAVTQALPQLFAACRQQVQTCYGMPVLISLTPSEIQAELTHVKATAANLDALSSALRKARHEAPEHARWLQAVEIWRKGVAYQLADLEGFVRSMLGTPTAAQIKALGSNND